jgi:hypothetical protein
LVIRLFLLIALEGMCGVWSVVELLVFFGETRRETIEIPLAYSSYRTCTVEMRARERKETRDRDDERAETSERERVRVIYEYLVPGTWYR